MEWWVQDKHGFILIVSASMDKTSKRTPLDPTAQDSISLPHPDYVKAVLPIPEESLHQSGDFVLTGCDDGDLRLWDVTVKPATLLSVVPGHFGAITALSPVSQPVSAQAPILMSASLDGTLRRWTAIGQATPRCLASLNNRSAASFQDGRRSRG